MSGFLIPKGNIANRTINHIITYIKKHFRKLSLKYHPDKNGKKEKFIELKDAYDILIDKEKRKMYDYQRKFNFLKDYNLDYNDFIYLNELYEKL